MNFMGQDETDPYFELHANDMVIYCFMFVEAIYNFFWTDFVQSALSQLTLGHLW